MATLTRLAALCATVVALPAHYTGKPHTHDVALIDETAAARPPAKGHTELDAINMRKRFMSAKASGATECEPWCEHRFRKYPMKAEEHCDNALCSSCGFCTDLLQALQEAEAAREPTENMGLDMKVDGPPMAPEEKERRAPPLHVPAARTVLPWPHMEPKGNKNEKHDVDAVALAAKVRA